MSVGGNALYQVTTLGFDLNRNLCTFRSIMGQGSRNRNDRRTSAGCRRLCKVRDIKILNTTHSSRTSREMMYRDGIGGLKIYLPLTRLRAYFSHPVDPH